MLPSYVEEEGVDPARGTETFAEIVLEVETRRWAGVPFYVRTGKALSAMNKSVVITFQDPGWLPSGLTGYSRPNRLIIGIDPPGLSIDLNINGPGDRRVIDPVTLDTEIRPGELPPYGQVLRGVLEGDPSLFVRGDMAVESWHIVEPVLEAWRANEVPLQDYPAGSNGPEAWPGRERAHGVEPVTTADARGSRATS
jgi:glucose-6-phosphate 1-dehydrogenase